MKQIGRIAKRAVRLFNADHISIVMDLDACNSNGCPLDFDKLEAFDAANFGHDIGGINRYLDRETGTLGGHFLPRCAKHK